MYNEEMVRSGAALWLATVKLCCVPLAALASPPKPSDEEREERQQEVWREWGERPSSVNEVLFP